MYDVSILGLAECALKYPMNRSCLSASSLLSFMVVTLVWFSQKVMWELFAFGQMTDPNIPIKESWSRIRACLAIQSRFQPNNKDGGAIKFFFLLTRTLLILI